MTKEYIKKTITLIFIALYRSIIYAAILMWLWNWVIPDIFNISAITYWQAYAIFIISNILFKMRNLDIDDKDK